MVERTEAHARSESWLCSCAHSWNSQSGQFEGGNRKIYEEGVEMQKRKRKSKFSFKKLVLKTAAYISGFICMMSVCALDSEKFWIPICAFVVSGALWWFTGCLCLMEEANEGGDV